MKKETASPYIINSISELHRLLELPKPKHPLVSVINLNEIKCHFDESIKSFVYNFIRFVPKRVLKAN